MNTSAHAKHVLEYSAFLHGKALDVEKIVAALAEAKEAAAGVRDALTRGDMPALQMMATACQRHAQTAQVLAHKLVSDTAKYRSRNPRIAR